jgi:photosystem II stability/assembly factor-like uncharacterized protein
MRRTTLIVILALIVFAPACSLADLPFSQSGLPEASPVPTETPLPTPLPTATIVPSPTPLSVRSSTGPALINITMFSERRGWGRTEDNLYQTSDGGMTWKPVVIPLVDNASIINVGYNTDDIFYVLSPGANGMGILSRSADAGRTWQQAEVPFRYASLDIITEGELFAIEDLGAGAGSHAIAIYQSLEYGSVWGKNFAHDPAAELGDTDLPLSGSKSGVVFLDPSWGWVTGSQPVEDGIYLYRTFDSGRTWSQYILQAPPGVSNFMASTYPPQKFPKDIFNAILPVDFYDASTSQARRYFYFTTDRGDNWTPGSPIPASPAFDFIDMQTGWAWGGGDLHFTKDGALTWNVLPVAFGAREDITDIDFVSPTHGWVLTLDDMYHARLYSTTDGGLTWTALIP